MDVKFNSPDYSFKSFNIENNIETSNKSFEEPYITIDEGEVKEVSKQQITTYPNVNSCFTITAVLSDGSMVGAHLVSPINDELERKLRQAKGIKEPNQILPTMKEKIGNRKITNLIVAGSLHSPETTTVIKKEFNKEGTLIEKEVQIKGDAWKAQDLIETNLTTGEFDGADVITTFISCYFEENLENNYEEGKGFKAINCVTPTTALITISTDKNGEAKLLIRDQNKYDSDPNQDCLMDDCHPKELINDTNSYEMWMEMKEYFGIFE